MNTALWIAQGFLAFIFVMAGSMKLRESKEQMAKKIGWVEDFSENTIRGIGALEVLAAVGLIVPPLVGVAPIVAPLAAAGLIVMMVGAVVVHIRRKESLVAISAVLLLIAAFVAWGRFGPHSF